MKKHKDKSSIPTAEQLASARKRYLDIEPRHFFYRLATEKVEEALKGQGGYTLAEALHVLFGFITSTSVDGRKAARCH